MADGSNPITLGDPVPWFTAPLINGATFDFHVFGGRWVVLAFLGSPANPAADEKITELMKDHALFDDDRIVVRGVFTAPPADIANYAQLCTKSFSLTAVSDAPLTRAFCPAATPRPVPPD